MIDTFVPGIFMDAHKQSQLPFASNVAALLALKAFPSKK